MTGFGNYGVRQKPSILSSLVAPHKPRVFVSYHHQRDQRYYDRFTSLFTDGYDIFTDTSIARRIDSDDSDYQRQVIREEHIAGSSITIVLCGAETWKRRWIDWEIHMTLNKKHALLGIILPTAILNQANEIIVPDRLLDNVNSGFAYWIHWTEDSQILKGAISVARAKALETKNIRNLEPRMQRSRS